MLNSIYFEIKLNFEEIVDNWDTRSSLQSPLSKTKPNFICETIVSYTSIFPDSAKPNILNRWTSFNVLETYNTPDSKRTTLNLSGLWSIYATSWAIKMIQQNDWTGKNCFHNIDCSGCALLAYSSQLDCENLTEERNRKGAERGLLLAYFQTQICCSTRFSMISPLCTGCS